MFWIGFIVGIALMIVLTLIAIGLYVLLMREIGVSYEDFKNLCEANEAALLSRDSRIEVWSEDDDEDDEKVFEARFAYPWSDDVNN